MKKPKEHMTLTLKHMKYSLIFYFIHARLLLRLILMSFVYFNLHLISCIYIYIYIKNKLIQNYILSPFINSYRILSNLLRMEKKDIWKRQQRVSTHLKQQSLPFKVRSTLYSKEKENRLEKSIQNAKARNTIKKAKLFNSPELIYALNETIREQTNLITQQQLSYRGSHFVNKTFHHGSTYSKVNTLPQLPQKTGTKHKYYAFHEERDKAFQLCKWVNDKLQAVKTKKTVSLQDILDYNQTVVNYALGQIIESVRKRCKQEGETLKFIWDSTFVLFQNLLNVLTTEIGKKDDQMMKNQKQLQDIYLTNINHVKNKNQQMQKHLDLLYQKMKRIIEWNRTLRKDRYKQEIKRRVLEFRQTSFSDALQQAIRMLLLQSNDPNVLKFAKKIVSALYKQKQLQGARKNTNKKKSLQLEAHQFVHSTAKEYVVSWLKQHSNEDEYNIGEAVYLTQTQKIQLLKVTDKESANKLNIYDLFQTLNASTQTETIITADASTQFQYQIKTRSFGVQTKKVFTNTACTQVKMELQSQNQNQDQIMRKNKSKPKKNSYFQNNNKYKSHKNSISKEKQKGSQINNNQYLNSPIYNQNSIIKNKQLNNFQNRKQNDVSQRNLIQKGQKANKIAPNLRKTSFLRRSSAGTSDFKSQIQDSHLNITQKISKSIKSIIRSQEQDNINYENSETKQLQKLSRIMTINKIEDVWQENSQQDGQNIMNYNTRTSKIINVPVYKSKQDKNVSNKNLVNNLLYKKANRIMSQPNQYMGFNKYKIKSLQKKKFQEIYESEMKSELMRNKQQMMRAVARKRSFYKKNNKINQKQMMFLWFKPNKNISKIVYKQFNQIDENIYAYFTHLTKNMTLPTNFCKFKAFQQNCSLFASIANNNLNSIQRTIPKNKQFINLTVSSIMKFISKLLFDYLRKIKGETQQINIQTDKVYYPLSIIVVDQMMHKYGLKEIAEKKLKDFMQKMATFVGVSQKISFFYRLFGVGDELIGADELLLYMKCLVLFDVKKTIPILNISKDFSIDRALTDRQTVLQNIDKITNQFFAQSMREQAKWKIQRYFCIYQLTGQFDIQRIATLLIDEFTTKKKQLYEDYLPIYRNCHGNFFPNLYKCIQVLTQSQNLPNYYLRMINQIYQNADIIDQNYGKSISEIRFIGACIKVGFPSYNQIKKKFELLRNTLINSINLSAQYTFESQQVANKIKRKYNIKICFEKQAPDYWLWSCAQIAYEIPLISSFSLLGNLKYFKTNNNI